ncbi:hypothetical protein BUALT_Bualt02G0150500 [Buddleja alternifolia]|uniref:NAP1-related protein 2 n=1 Tax=Buddleja alternifolia TaxID=168488 RepID=A0AAV6YBF5_9LAMI|nr:hypothetical protein BUALT_Bualt02G0150500 [Buddleja alternifolia]
MGVDKGKKQKLEDVDEENNGVDHIDQDLVFSIEKLQSVQDELEKINEEASEKVLEVEQKYNEIRKPVYDRRNDVIKSIPDFWLTAFMSHPALNELLTEEDQKIFKYLSNIEVEDSIDVKSGYSIAFSFNPNPYFENAKLTKSFKFLEDGTTEITSTSIKWKEGMGLANGVAEEKNGNKRSHAEESFFSWFNDAQHKGDMDEIQDEQVAEIIKDDLWPNPLTYFNNEADEEDPELDDDEVVSTERFRGEMGADKGKKQKLGDVEEENNGVDHIDQDLVVSIEKLQSVQDDLEKINEEASEKVLEVEQKYNEIRKPVYDRRNDVIKTIPDFWLTAFMSHPALNELLTEEDQKIFKYLSNIEVEDSTDVKSGYSIAFSFNPNPYFEDAKLTKSFKFLEEGTTEITATSIKWKEGMGLANGVAEEKNGNKRAHAEESFFSWFNDALHKGDMDEIQDEEADEEDPEVDDDDEVSTESRLQSYLPVTFIVIDRL